MTSTSLPPRSTNSNTRLSSPHLTQPIDPDDYGSDNHVKGSRRGSGGAPRKDYSLHATQGPSPSPPLASPPPPIQARGGRGRGRGGGRGSAPYYLHPSGSAPSLLTGPNLSPSPHPLTENEHALHSKMRLMTRNHRYAINRLKSRVAFEQSRALANEQRAAEAELVAANQRLKVEASNVDRSSLADETIALMNKNNELQRRVRELEGQVLHLQALNSTLEEQLEATYGDEEGGDDADLLHGDEEDYLYVEQGDAVGEEEEADHQQGIINP